MFLRRIMTVLLHSPVRPSVIVGLEISSLKGTGKLNPVQALKVSGGWTLYRPWTFQEAEPCTGPESFRRLNPVQALNVSGGWTLYRPWKFQVAEPCTGPESFRRLNPVQALKVSGGWSFEISRQSPREGGKVVSPVLRLPSPPTPSGNFHGSHFC